MFWDEDGADFTREVSTGVADIDTTAKERDLLFCETETLVLALMPLATNARGFWCLWNTLGVVFIKDVAIEDEE